MSREGRRAPRPPPLIPVSRPYIQYRLTLHRSAACICAGIYSCVSLKAKNRLSQLDDPIRRTRIVHFPSDRPMTAFQLEPQPPPPAERLINTRAETMRMARTGARPCGEKLETLSMPPGADEKLGCGGHRATVVLLRNVAR